jgi:anaerobic selenocysteine-containing dehydrogenase
MEVRDKVETGEKTCIKSTGHISMPAPMGHAYKKRVYSPNRTLYPLKRTDWDPNGERNPQNRGISKYTRISWDEAVDIIAGEITKSAVRESTGQTRGYPELAAQWQDRNSDT